MEINIQNVSMTYPSGKQALQNLSLELRSPSLIGLLGPNGAGKSTLMKLLVAALLPTSGSILVDGQPLLKTERQLKAQLGYLPQDFGLFNELTVAQFLDYMAVVIHHGTILFTGTPEQLIQAAEGHVGVFWEREAGQEQGLHITARVNTSQGVRCRAVADALPAYVQRSEPSLEDAYLYLISREAVQ